MEINKLLLPEFEKEMKTTRTMLERVPEGKQDFKPHEKSMPLGKLAAHISRLPQFATMILEMPGMEITERKQPPLVMESRQQLLADLDAAAEKARTAIANATDEQWQQNWKFTFQGNTLTNDSRVLTYRTVFLNHLIHHRAQLGVYLRLNDVPLPASYGPSADDTMGF